MKKKKGRLVPTQKVRKDGVTQTYYVNPNKKNKNNKIKTNKVKEQKEQLNVSELREKLIKRIEDIKSLTDNEFNLDNLKNKLLELLTPEELNKFINIVDNHNKLIRNYEKEFGFDYKLGFVTDNKKIFINENNALFKLFDDIANNKYKENEIYKKAKNLFDRYFNGESFINEDLILLKGIKLWIQTTLFGNAQNGLQFKLYDELFKKLPKLTDVFKQAKVLPFIDVTGTFDLNLLVNNTSKFAAFWYEQQAFKDSFINALNKNKPNAIKHFMYLNDLLDHHIDRFLNLPVLPEMVNNKEKNKLLELISKDNNIKKEGFLKYVEETDNEIKDELRDILLSIVKEGKRNKTIVGVRNQFAEPFIGVKNSKFVDEGNDEKVRELLVGKVVNAGYQSAVPYGTIEFQNGGQFRLFFIVDRNKLKDYLKDNVGFMKFDYTVGITKDFDNCLETITGYNGETEIIMKNYWKIIHVSDKRQKFNETTRMKNNFYDVYLMNISKEEYFEELKKRRGKKYDYS